MPDAPHFIYFADPMCSWCYGFSPVMGALARQFEGRLPVRVVMGGLKPFETRPMREKDRAYLRETWGRVGELSGQPFDLAVLDRDTFTYDTEPACRAVVALRRLAPERTLAFLARVSQAFYAQNRDVTDDAVLADLAAEFGVDRALYLGELQSEAARAETIEDFRFAKASGVEGFPLLAAGTLAGGYALLTHGFRPLDGLPQAVESWLAQGAPVTPVETAG